MVSTRKLAAQMEEMARIAALDERALFADSNVSAWTPAEHLDHLIKVSSSIVQRLLDLDAPAGPRGISPLGRLILLLGRIPRGRGKAPERLRGTRATAPELLAALERLRARIAQLEDPHLAHARGCIVPHPKFGGLNPSQALRFAVLHNEHHFKIVRDILRGR